MKKIPKCALRRDACIQILGRLSIMSAWCTPLVQAVSLPAHAQTSSVLCEKMHVPGRWRLEMFGLAASVREITFVEGGTTEQGFISAWKFSDGELVMAQGMTWLLTGTFRDCDLLAGTYVNTLVIPPLGNIVIRRGDWIASRVE